MASVLVVGCWVAFFLYWLAYAFGTKPATVRQSTAARLSHRVPLWIAAVLLLTRGNLGRLDQPLWTASPAARLAAVVITVVGLAGAIWSRRTLGRNWSSDVTRKQGHELIQTGPYRLVRNPIYTSMLLMLLGSGLLVDRVRGLVAVALALAGFWLKIRQEESYMQAQFPESYPPYRRRVKSLVPFVF
ncbi:MAG TPA: isoprenylcysteine carboxylmethyltransferase family protein [Terriglobales bacterium]|nr:isoprenylcysteine carboxylmethyltransferase family protein [Terriglobales bacterium]